MSTFRKVVHQVDRHRFTIVGDQYKVMFFTPTQNFWIQRLFRRRSRISDCIDNKVWLLLKKLSLIERLEILIKKISNAHAISFCACLSALILRNFCLIGEGLASCCFRTSLLHSNQSVRYFETASLLCK